MRRGTWLGLLLLAVLPGPAPRAAEASEAAAVQGAEAWLKLLDGGQFGASWDQASTMFRRAISRQAWEQQARTAREPLGKVAGRKLASKQLTHELPGAPDGTYLVLTYDTRFERKERAHETVTMMLDGGQFRGAGYFIR